MASKLIFAIGAIQLFTFAGLARAEEYEAAIDEACRRAMKEKPAGFIWFFELVLDSKGKVVRKQSRSGMVTEQTKVVMAAFNEKTKRLVPGKAIEGGIKADLFDVKDSTVRALITIGPDKKISQILVTKEDEPLVDADREFDAILKGAILNPNGRGTCSFVRLERDENGKIIKDFGRIYWVINKDTVVAMAKYNEKEKKWETGDPIPKGVNDDVFKNYKQPVYVRMSPQEDGRGIGKILLIQVGADPKK
jgi:hypothetical protein